MPSTITPSLQKQQYQSLIERINDRIQSKSPWFSFEYFPPKTINGVGNLMNRLDYMAQGRPLFCNITWHAGGDSGSNRPNSSMSIAYSMMNYCGVDTVLHLTCTGSTKQQLLKNLTKAKEIGIKNVLALRGDSVADGVDCEFRYAVDLVEFIRQEFGSYFVIGVAGYPSGHPESTTYEDSIHYLKAKIDAGADFVITQLFFAVDIFIKFVDDCRNAGINCPILPGILPIQSYQSLTHIIKLSQLKVPEEVMLAIEPVKENDEAVRNFGIYYATNQCRQVIESEKTYGIHLYTLNREVSCVQILKNLNMWVPQPQRSLPWRSSSHHLRCNETVRPIFWCQRPLSYVCRTSDWDEFPNGRWGYSSSAAFSEMTEYYLYHLLPKLSKDELLKMWGYVKSEQDVWNIFNCYLLGTANNNGVKITATPFTDEPLAEETSELILQLAEINKLGVLTINSQPRVNCVHSSDAVHGWGNPGGYVYKKAYLEFFTSRTNIDRLKLILPDYPSVNYHITDNTNDEDYTNCDELQPVAVTWGVFPGKEIIQPTVVDPVAFKSWKSEAFSLWREQWAKLYEESSISWKVINNIITTYCLVNLVDNEFPKESCLFEIVRKMLDKDQNI